MNSHPHLIIFKKSDFISLSIIIEKKNHDVSWNLIMKHKDKNKAYIFIYLFRIGDGIININENPSGKLAGRGPLCFGWLRVATLLDRISKAFNSTPESTHTN